MIPYDIAHAASWDAANRNMRRAGRTTWNEDDSDAFCAEFERLRPLAVELAELKEQAGVV